MFQHRIHSQVHHKTEAIDWRAHLFSNDVRNENENCVKLKIILDLGKYYLLFAEVRYIYGVKNKCRIEQSDYAWPNLIYIYIFTCGEWSGKTVCGYSASCFIARLLTRLQVSIYVIWSIEMRTRRFVIASTLTRKCAPAAMGWFMIDIYISASVAQLQSGIDLSHTTNCVRIMNFHCVRAIHHI